MLNFGMLDRLLTKSAEQFLFVELCTQYALPPVAAEALMSQINRYVQERSENVRASGQILVPAVSVTEPAGKPIKNCKLVNVAITVDLARGAAASWPMRLSASPANMPGSRAAPACCGGWWYGCRISSRSLC